jgi:hypothetical protein
MGLLRDVLAPAVSATSPKVTAPAVPDAGPLPDLPPALADEDAPASLAASADDAGTGTAGGEAGTDTGDDTGNSAATVRSHRPETIATSWRGLVDELLPPSARKNLLGE